LTIDRERLEFCERLYISLLANAFVVLYTLRYLHPAWPGIQVSMLGPILIALFAAFILSSMFFFPAFKRSSVLGLLVAGVAGVSPLVALYLTTSIFCSLRGIALRP
jgi:hypothetical protein